MSIYIKGYRGIERKNINFDYRDFCQDIKALKEFVAIRDENSLFDDVKDEKRIGIPCFILDSGVITLDKNYAIEESIKNR
ncbi:glutaredoxin [Clostridium beijerinckii]|uniref:glutaredoxin n=1 Tax=Clostridium beijerinckii TaxID=1520 RepID=UPI001F4C3695|nr:glutaredoxin [Clostridium beijerinckii]NRW85789.1 glutaredoxin-related protein [Clostridium beijerinckii]